MSAGPATLPLELQAISVGVLLGFLVVVVHLVRRHKLSLRDSLLWLFSTALALVLMAFPMLLQRLAAALQVEVPSNAFFAMAFLYTLANLLVLTLGVSAGAVRARRLTQECALLRGEIEQLRIQIASKPKEKTET
jgi:hypothetical protein